jgi:hypothetical protein
VLDPASLKKSAVPRRSELPANAVKDFRKMLSAALDARDDEGRKWADAKWGCYAFYDYDGEPIYVGQTVESLRVRIQRHLTNQRTDAVAMRILDIFEVAELRMWPLWKYEKLKQKGNEKEYEEARKELDALEYTAYLNAINESRFKAILNEKIPPVSIPLELPESITRPLVDERTREERGHPDIRIARRAETISRLAAVAHERGEVSPGLRRVLVIQAVRLAYLSAERLAYVEGRESPRTELIDVVGLVGGSVLEERTDPGGRTDQDGDDQLELL